MPTDRLSTLRLPRRFYYETHHQLRSHLAAFVTAYNFAKHLKTLTPYEYICKLRTKGLTASPLIRSRKCRD